MAEYVSCKEGQKAFISWEPIENEDELETVCNNSLEAAVFPHKHINKAQWVSADQSTKNKIDHICIKHKALTVGCPSEKRRPTLGVTSPNHGEDAAETEMHELQRYKTHTRCTLGSRHIGTIITQPIVHWRSMLKKSEDHMEDNM